MARTVCFRYYDSPCGKMVLASFGAQLCLCDWSGMPRAGRNMRRLARCLDAEFSESATEVIDLTKARLDEYFAGKRKTFDIPLRPVGTIFQQRVWNALSGIPYGQTRTYRDIALQVGTPKGVRAVAQAIGANGLGILIPCHRVIGSDRSLTGFAGGLDVKRRLLELEGAF